MYVILLALMLPVTSGLVDCRSACHSCRENKEVPAMVEVYCSMCEECKERRRDKFTATSTTNTIGIQRRERLKYDEYSSTSTEPFLFGPTNDNIHENVKKEFATAGGYPFGDFNENRRVEHGRRQHRRYPPMPRPLVMRPPMPCPMMPYPPMPYPPCPGQDYDSNSEIEDNRLRPEDIPEGCPTPPDCSDEEQSPGIKTNPSQTTTTTTTTTTSTTTTRRPCPKIKPCKNKKKKRPNLPPPCMPPMCPCPMPCPGPMYGVPAPPMCPCPMPYPGPGPMSGAPASPMWPCMGPQCGIPPPPMPPMPRPIPGPNESTTPSTSQNATSNDYIYMYVGVPKNVLKQ